MQPEKGYRALRRGRVSVSGQTYFITICCAGRCPALGDDRARGIVLRSLADMLERGMARLDGFVVMPDHLHFIFELGEGHELSAVLREFKKYTALNANRAMGRTSAFWQDGYYEHAIRTSEEWTVRMDYMLGNPVRAGLAERVGEYRWARYGPWEANGSRGQRPLPQSD